MSAIVTKMIDDTRLISLGQALKKARGERSQAVIARELGIHKNTLSLYERGKRTPDIEFLEGFARVTGSDVQALIGLQPASAAALTSMKENRAAEPLSSLALARIPAGVNPAIAGKIVVLMTNALFEAFERSNGMRGFIEGRSAPVMAVFEAIKAASNPLEVDYRPLLDAVRKSSIAFSAHASYFLIDIYNKVQHLQDEAALDAAIKAGMKPMLEVLYPSDIPA
ncbi:MAG: helix-turn-helix transcriptional regulator [Gammaproteobacteria bacterium]|nr:helix-turn-helix transcriptional regulator [Gammaproteobacteria bacterium]